MKDLKNIKTRILIGAVILLFLAITKADTAAKNCEILYSDFHAHGTPTLGLIAGFTFIGFISLLVFVVKD